MENNTIYGLQGKVKIKTEEGAGIPWKTPSSLVGDITPTKKSHRESGRQKVVDKVFEGKI